MSRLLPFAFIIGALGLYFGYAQPTFSTSIAELRKNHTELDASLLAAGEFKEKEAELTEKRADIPPEQLARLDAFLPDTVDNVQLIVDLDSLAERSGVNLSSFSIGSAGGDSAEAPPGGAYDPNEVSSSSQSTETLDLSVTITGSYSAFKSFLASVEQSLRLLDVVSLSIQDSETGVYTYNLTLRLYWLRQ